LKGGNVKIMGKSKDELLRLDPDCIKSRLNVNEIVKMKLRKKVEK